MQRLANLASLTVLMLDTKCYVKKKEVEDVLIDQSCKHNQNQMTATYPYPISANLLSAPCFVR